MADLTELIDRLPIDDLAAKVGASPDDVRAAAAQAVPTLVAGLTGQAANDDQLAAKLAEHDNDLAQGQINVDDVDAADGEKIVGHLFGGETDSVAQALSGAAPAAGVDQGLIKKLLPILAPIVLSYVMGQFGKGGAGTSGGSLGDLLGGMLGGGGKNGGPGGIDLGGVLGSVLGGGKSGGDNPLGSILGGILGGKK